MKLPATEEATKPRPPRVVGQQEEAEKRRAREPEPQREKLQRLKRKARHEPPRK